MEDRSRGRAREREAQRALVGLLVLEGPSLEELCTRSAMVVQSVSSSARVGAATGVKAPLAS